MALRVIIPRWERRSTMKQTDHARTSERFRPPCEPASGKAQESRGRLAQDQEAKVVVDAYPHCFLAARHQSNKMPTPESTPKPRITKAKRRLQLTQYRMSLMSQKMREEIKSATPLRDKTDSSNNNEKQT